MRCSILSLLDKPYFVSSDKVEVEQVTFMGGEDELSVSS
jgi:hypothetical protein